MSKLLRDITSSLKEGYIDEITPDRHGKMTKVTLVVPQWSTKAWARVKKVLDKAYHARTNMYRRLVDVPSSFILSRKPR